MIVFNEHERKINEKIIKLKEQSGSHSPNLFTIAEKIPELNVKVDACFLSNPYATDLFLAYFKKELLLTGKLRDVLEFYPSQNPIIAEILAEHLNIPANNIFIGNGAIEVIQAILHNFVHTKTVISIPTFSSYYEFVKPDVAVIFYRLLKENNYLPDIDNYISFIKKENPHCIVIINPNNPNGGYLKYEEIIHILNELKHIPNIIIDESLIHFAFENDRYELKSIAPLITQYNNLIVIKSMSKDFGIAGIRAGYGVMNSTKIDFLLKNGYLWNTNGLSEYFFRLYTRKDFLTEYEKVRVEYIKDAQQFFNDLTRVSSIKVYPSMANFALAEILDGNSTNVLSRNYS